MATATAPSPMLDAVAYARRGLHVFPLLAGSKEPDGELAPNGQHNATTDEATIRAWWTRKPNANIGLALEPSGLIAFDVDKPEGYATLAEIEREYGKLETARQKSGSGNLHILAKKPPHKIRGSYGGITMRGSNYIVVAPSLHESGNRYEWIAAPWDVPPCELPAALTEKLKREQSAGPAKASTSPLDNELQVKRAKAWLTKAAPAVMGDYGEAKLFAVCCKLVHGFHLSDSDALAAILSDYNPRCDPPWDDGEIDEIKRKIDEARTKCDDPSAFAVEDRPLKKRSNRPEPDQRASTGTEDSTMSDDERDTFTDESDMSDEDRAAYEADARDEAPPPSDEDAPRDAKQKRKPKIDGAVKVAAKYVAKHATSPDGVGLLRRWRGNWYRWTPERGCYAEQSDDQMRAELYRKLQLGKRADVSEVLDAMIAVDDVLIDHVELGNWLGDGAPPYPSHEIAACRNGLLYLPTETLAPASPRFFTTSSLGVVYDPAAPPPAMWNAFLRGLWPTDEESRVLLQDWIGYLLTADTRQQKMLLAVGPKRSGKGTIGRITTALLGEPNVVTPTLASLSANFGLQSWIGKPAAIIGDARLSGRTDVAQVVERLLSISGEDGQTIDRKYLRPWQGTLPTRIAILTNEPPSFKDASDALPGRMLALQLTRSWFGNEDVNLSTKLTAELGGILRWAIAGWRRLRDRGRFVQPTSSASLIHDIEDLGSPVKAWARERCVVDADVRTKEWWLKPGDAYTDFKKWCEQNGNKNIQTQTIFGRDVKTALGCDRRQVGADKAWVYIGLRLKTVSES